MSTRFRTSIISTDEGFDALETGWLKLSSNSQASIFQSYSWCREWWRVYGAPLRAAIITVYDGDRLVGLLPLCLSGSYRGLPLRRAFLIGTGTIDYGGVLIDNDADEADVREYLLKELLSLPWDALDIRQLSPQAARDFFGRIGDEVSSRAVLQETTYPAALAADTEGLRATLSKKFRTNIDYNRRRLERENKLEFRLSEGDVAADMEVFFDLHQRLWRKRRMPGAFFSAKRRRFHSQAAADLARRGELRLAFLTVNDEPVASVYGFKERDIFYYYLGGYESDWASRSVSTLLLYDLMVGAIAEGCRVFDFLRGDEDYKRRWGGEPAENYRLIAARPTRRGALLARVLLSENELSVKIKSRLARS